jgi:O-antigen/teichoic acid export membrane protein
LLVLNTQLAVLAASAWLIPLVTGGNGIFHLWLHNQAVYSMPLITLMLISLFPFALANSFTLVLLATNKIHRAVIWLVPAGAFSLTLAAFGAHFFGLIGAAIGMIAFETLTLLVVSLVESQTQIGVRRCLAEAISAETIISNYKSALSMLHLNRPEVS